MIYFTSDPHYNHDRIIEYAGRPFDNVADMNEHMIKVWNEVVQDDDDVYMLGDFYFAPLRHGHMSLDEIMTRLRGKKHFIRGNHDIEHYKKDHILAETHEGWESVQDYAEVKFGKTRFVLCHYPLETWRNAHRGWFHLHGHCHGTLQRKIPHREDVGVDCHPNLAPFSAEELRDHFNKQPNYEPQDHHGHVEPIKLYEI